MMLWSSELCVEIICGFDGGNINIAIFWDVTFWVGKELPKCWREPAAKCTAF
jgi:hypothetical protein